MISTIESRPCDGQPGRMCPSDCDVDCHFNNATLDRVMNYPLRRVQPDEIQQPTAPVQNLPYDWFTVPAWLPRAVLYVGSFTGIGYGLYSYFF